MRMTSKGQVTVPKPVRDALGIGPGSNVGFEVRGGEAVLVRLDDARSAAKATEMVRQLQEHGATLARAEWTIGLTTDEIMDILRGPRADADSR